MSVTTCFMSNPDWHVDDRLPHFHLQTVAKTLAKVRSDALEGHEPGVGDDAWVFGSRCYRRSCHALTTLSTEPEGREWLSVLADGNAFTIFVNGIPMKFYASESEELSDRNLRKVRTMPINPKQVSLFQKELDSSTTTDWSWLIRVERLDDGTASRVIFFQANAVGETRNHYFVTMGDEVPAASEVANVRREAIDIPAPTVGPREDAEGETALEESGSE